MATEHDDIFDDLDFAMLTPPTRPGPCKAAAEPEVEPVEARLERERQAAPFIIDHFEGHDINGERCTITKTLTFKEVRHGSGNVKV